MKYITSFIAKFLLVSFFGPAIFADDFTVAVRAHRGVDLAIKKWQPTMDALAEKIPEHSFTLLPILSLDEITKSAGEGKFDFVFTNPSSYVELEVLHDAKALATLNNKRINMAQDRFGSVIFTHAMNESIQSIEDLKGKNLMAVSEPAFGGWRVAWLEMLKKGFDPYKELKSLTFAANKTQPEVVMAVLGRKVDAGVGRTDLLERMEAEGKIDMRYLRIINNKENRDFPFFLSTDLYPEWAFAAMKGIPDDVSNQVQKALFDISSDSAAARSGKYMGWKVPLDYGPVKALMQSLEVGPYKQQ